MDNDQNKSIQCDNSDTSIIDELTLQKISGAGSSKKEKCINWECKDCARKSTDPFYVGGMHNENCTYRGIVGCKCCKHYVKGVRCQLASTGEN